MVFFNSTRDLLFSLTVLLQLLKSKNRTIERAQLNILYHDIDQLKNLSADNRYHLNIFWDILFSDFQSSPFHLLVHECFQYYSNTVIIISVFLKSRCLWSHGFPSQWKCCSFSKGVSFTSIILLLFTLFDSVCLSVSFLFPVVCYTIYWRFCLLFSQ